MNIPDKIFNYLIEQNQPLSDDDIFEKFDKFDLNEVAQANHRLEQEDFIEETKELPSRYIVLEHGRKMYNDAVAQLRRKEEKSGKEYQKLQLEIDDLVNKLSDYDKTKKRAREAALVGRLSIVIAALALISQWLCNKPG